MMRYTLYPLGTQQVRQEYVGLLRSESPPVCILPELPQSLDA